MNKFNILYINVFSTFLINLMTIHLGEPLKHEYMYAVHSKNRHSSSASKFTEMIGAFVGVT